MYHNNHDAINPYFELKLQTVNLNKICLIRFTCLVSVARFALLVYFND